MEMITSAQNQKIKDVIKLEDAKERRRQNLIIIEGEREIDLAHVAGIEIVTLFHCDELRKAEYGVANKLGDEKIIKVSKQVFSKIAYREHPDGYLAIAKPKHMSLSEVKLRKNPLIIILENVEKPGNLGAILRSADAGDVDAVMVCEPKTDLFNPNIIRASMGAIFTKQVVVCSNAEAKEWLNSNKIKAYAATDKAKTEYFNIDWKIGGAIVLGTEYEGLSDEWLKFAENIKIPMSGHVDSLNVSVSAAVILFEAVRQRTLNM